MPDNETLILEQLTNLTGKVSSIDVHLDSIKETQSHQQNQLDHQNQLLAEHIMGVQTNSERLTIEREARIKYQESTGKRLDKLEEGPKFRAQAFKYLIHLTGWFTAAGGALLAYKEFIAQIPLP